MTLIEGVGDEVVEFFIGLVVVLIGVIAWWSTRIADRPVIRTVLVFERRSQNHSSQINHSTNQEERRIESQRDYIQDLAITPPQNVESESVPEEEENKPPEAGGSRAEVDRSSGDSPAHSTVPTSVEVEQREILESMDSEEATVLRRRRLEFFQSRPEAESARNNSEGAEVNPIPTLNHNENTTTTETAAETPTINQDDTETRTEEENDIRIKLKYINDDLKLVNGKLKEPLGDFKRRHFELELANNKLVRLIFKGQVLQRDELSLQSCGLYDNCVVHCLVHQKKSNNTSDRTILSSTNLGAGNSTTGTDSSRPRIPTSNQQPGREWDLGNLFFAIVSFFLGAAWYFRYEYAQLYTVTATVALVGLTGIFTVLLVGMYFPDPEPPVQSVRS